MSENKEICRGMSSTTLGKVVRPLMVVPLFDGDVLLINHPTLEDRERPCKRPSKIMFR